MHIGYYFFHTNKLVNLQLISFGMFFFSFAFQLTVVTSDILNVAYIIFDNS